jgi:hypothetical protein
MKPLAPLAVVLGLAAFRLARALLGTVGLQYEFGWTVAVLGAASLVLFRFTAPVRIGAFLALTALWGWPWYAALLIAVPRLPLVLPGLISNALAKRRHPRPLWPSLRAV